MRCKNCEKLKNELDLYKTLYRAKHDDVKNCLGCYRKALEEIEAATKINCEEICGRKFENCNDTSCLSAEVRNIISKAKDKICYWDKNIDMSKATLQVDGKVICRFDNDNQMVIINDNYSDTTKRKGKNEQR